MSRIVTHLVTAGGGVLAGAALGAAYILYLRAALRAARHAAAHDPLTGLPNRTTVGAQVRAALRAGRPVCVLLVDLDAFKRVNDTFGHAAGDGVLRQVAARLTGLTDRCLLVGRLAGDEFVLVVEGPLSAGLAAARATHRALTTRPYQVGTARLEMFASVGVAASRPAVTAGRLLHEADLAMYRAKSNGVEVCAQQPGATADTPVARPARRCRDRRAETPERSF